MFKVKCRCGKTEKNFKFDIGSFFINECCEEAGFDEKGMKAEELVKELDEALDQLPDEVQEEVIEDMIESVKEDLEQLTKKELIKLCEERDLKFSKNESKKQLLKKLVEAE